MDAASSSSAPPPPPLLRSISSHSPTAPPPLEESSTTIDDVVDRYVGSSGNSWPQLLQVLLISCAWAFDAHQTFINVFTDAQPAWHCTNPDDETCSSSSSPCSMSSDSWAWDQPKHSSILSDWNLECSDPSLQGLPASAYFAGCLVGGFILSTLADSRLGRKNMLVLSSLIMSFSGILAAASPNLWVYVALRFVSGFGRATLNSSALVLASEMVGRRWRGEVSVVGYFLFTFGFVSLPAMAFLNRWSSWRNLYLWTSIPCFCYSILTYYLVYESPRWLLVRGRSKEAIETLRNMGLGDENLMYLDFSSIGIATEAKNMDMFSTLKMIWERKWALRRLASGLVLGFGCGVAYYGMPLGVGTLGFNLYVSVTLNALAELPAALLTFFLVAKLDRRISVLMFSMISAACSILCVFQSDRGVRTTMEVVSFFTAVTAFNVLLIYCLELFPTSVRNSALQLVRQAIAIGCGIAPFLVVAGRKEEFWSYGVFGLVIGCCGLFACCLPETRGRRICDTIEEEEYLEKLIK